MECFKYAWFFLWKVSGKKLDFLGLCKLPCSIHMGHIVLCSWNKDRMPVALHHSRVVAMLVWFSLVRYLYLLLTRWWVTDQSDIDILCFK